MNKLRFRASYPNKDEYSNKPWNTAFIIFCCSHLTTKNPDVIDKAKLSGIVVMLKRLVIHGILNCMTLPLIW